MKEKKPNEPNFVKSIFSISKPKYSIKKDINLQNFNSIKNEHQILSKTKSNGSGIYEEINFEQDNYSDISGSKIEFVNIEKFYQMKILKKSLPITNAAL